MYSPGDCAHWQCSGVGEHRGNCGRGTAVCSSLLQKKLGERGARFERVFVVWFLRPRAFCFYVGAHRAFLRVGDIGGASVGVVMLL